MLCHVVHPDEIMMTHVNLCCCLKSEVEGCLENCVMVHSNWRILSFAMTYTLHLAEQIPDILNNAHGLQPEFVHTDHKEAERIYYDSRQIALP